MIGANATAKSEFYEENEEVEFTPAQPGTVDWSAIADAIRAEMPTSAHADMVDEQTLLDDILFSLRT